MFSPSFRTRSVLVGVAASSVAALGITGVTTQTTAEASTAHIHHARTTGTPVRLVQANIKVSEPDSWFAADMRKIIADRPDFVTLNEAHSRTQRQITPRGYRSYRGGDSEFTRETPVLWLRSKWKKIHTGTRYLTTRHVRWGIRAVNWVTVRNRHTGQVMSVISAHPAPTIRRTRGLLPVFVKHLGALTDKLSQRGPVLVGGDFNAAYRGALYSSAAFPRTGLAPTYAKFGAPARGTGDHFGNTIDYVLWTRHRGLVARNQGTIELRSDHDAVWARFTLRHRAK